MLGWKKALLNEHSNISEAIACIESGGIQVAVVVDPDMKILGLVTDGDIRRAILRGISLDKSVAEVLNPKPKTISVGTSRKKILEFMVENDLHHVPIVDSNSRIVDLETIDALIKPEKKENWVILMAGGIGSRLRPLTDECPKPMLKVGGKPILQNIIESFMDQGFGRFCISINYKGELIKDYFKDGKDFGADIIYIEENKKLGTAGALSLIPFSSDKPLVVMNADILTRADFSDILSFHHSENASGTMVVREYTEKVAFGVVSVQGNKIKNIVEKPEITHLVNSGIYVLSPETLTLIPKNSYFDMPSLFSEILNNSFKASAYRLNKYWVDIGRVEEYNRTIIDWAETDD